MLAAVGVLTADQLRARGALDTYLALARANITNNLNMLWALVGALDPWPEGTDWREVAAGEQRLPLLLAVESREQAREAVLEAAGAAARAKPRKPKRKSGSAGAKRRRAPAELASNPFGAWAPGLPFEDAESAGRAGRKKR